jgi:amino acid transporter
MWSMSESLTLGSLKQLLLGKPIPSHLAHHERLSKTTGLAILSSDALSSVAYATEAVLATLVLAGPEALRVATPIGASIAVLLLVVAFSYRQTIHAYPGGGGAYIVAKENLGVTPGLVAAGALLIDYVLTVAVSISAGVAALTSAVPQWHDHRVALALAFLALLALGNLRGVRESGMIFSIPTYFFLGGLLVTLLAALARGVAGELEPVVARGTPIAAVAGQSLTAFLVLRAFAAGCTAMTGVEAVSNGVPAFKPPEAKNAAQTLVIMAVLCVGLFLGITLLARAYGVTPLAEGEPGYETVVSQIARGVFGGRGFFYYCVQAGTMLILVLAANTAFSDFPRLASIIARDRYLPRQFMNQGDRLAFSNGIMVLSVIAAALIVAFEGETHRLLPLYMVGVFVSFSLSQSGMVVKWKRGGERGWLGHALLNAVGAVLTSLVLLVVAVTKFSEGAWVIVLLIPLLVLHFRQIHWHYALVAAQLSLKSWKPLPRRRNTVVVPISGVHRAVLQALDYARSLGDDVRAVYVDTGTEATATVRADWEQWGNGVRLVVLPSPYRSLMEPLLDYLEQVEAERPEDFVTVVLPEFVPARFWHNLLHNQRALLIKGALLFKPNVIVTSVPFHLRR